MIQDLIRLADSLDKMGLGKTANKVDGIIKKSQWFGNDNKNRYLLLIDSLKNTEGEEIEIDRPFESFFSMDEVKDFVETAKLEDETLITGKLYETKSGYLEVDLKDAPSNEELESDFYVVGLVEDGEVIDSGTEDEPKTYYEDDMAPFNEDVIPPDEIEFDEDSIEIPSDFPEDIEELGMESGEIERMDLGDEWDSWLDMEENMGKSESTMFDDEDEDDLYYYPKGNSESRKRI